MAAFAYGASRFYPHFWAWPPTRAQAVVLGWLVILLAAYRIALRRAARAGDARSENGRWILLGMAGLFLLQGLIRATRHGAGDAEWYGAMLADMVAQVRAGVFPVWSGQSEYQFQRRHLSPARRPGFPLPGGAARHPQPPHAGRLRPAKPPAGAGRPGRGFFRVFQPGIPAAAPARARGGPGAALPRLPRRPRPRLQYRPVHVVDHPAVDPARLVRPRKRSFQRRRAFGSGPCVPPRRGALGLCWWGHSPIALWLTIFAGAAQLVRVLAHPPTRRGWRDAAAGAAAFAAIAAYYPIAFGALLSSRSRRCGPFRFRLPGPAPSPISCAGPTSSPPAALGRWSPTGRGLGDFQLGYALWGLLAFAAWNIRRVHRAEARFLLGLSGLLLLLLTPIPGLNLALWRLVPAVVRNVTGNWVMNRLYLILAGAIIYGVAATATEEAPGHPGRWRTLRLLVVLGCIWSLLEASKFAKGSRIDGRAMVAATTQLRPENAMATRFAYLIFPRLPAYYSEGVVDPLLGESAAGRARPTDPSHVQPAARRGGRRRPRPGGILRRAAAGQLPAGRRGVSPRARETLSPGPGGAQPRPGPGASSQIRGVSSFREYALPAYGEAESFGVGDRHAGLVALWTSNPDGDAITVRFFPDGSAGTAAALQPFAHLTWMAYDPARLPIAKSPRWIPYRASVTSPSAAWLETPRMYQQGYAATIGGRPAAVRKSAEGLVEVQVPAGTSVVTLGYRAPAGLAALFWTPAIRN